MKKIIQYIKFSVFLYDFHRLVTGVTEARVLLVSTILSELVRVVMIPKEETNSIQNQYFGWRFSKIEYGMNRILRRESHPYHCVNL